MRILIADRQETTRSALRMLLQEEDGMTVVSEAADSEGLVGQMVSSHPDLVVLDWDLPGTPVAMLLTEIRALGDHTYIVVLSGRPEAASKAIEAGADAFFSKVNPPRQLLTVIHGLESGDGHD